MFWNTYGGVEWHTNYHWLNQSRRWRFESLHRSGKVFISRTSSKYLLGVLMPLLANKWCLGPAVRTLLEQAQKARRPQQSTYRGRYLPSSGFVILYQSVVDPILHAPIHTCIHACMHASFHSSCSHPSICWFHSLSASFSLRHEMKDKNSKRYLALKEHFWAN